MWSSRLGEPSTMILCAPKCCNFFSARATEVSSLCFWIVVAGWHHQGITDSCNHVLFIWVLIRSDGFCFIIPLVKFRLPNVLLGFFHGSDRIALICLSCDAYSLIFPYICNKFATSSSCLGVLTHLSLSYHPSSSSIS